MPFPDHRVVAVSCIKNEADIVEAFVRHTLAFVGRMVVLDNGSADGTRDIVSALQAEGLALDVVDDATTGKYHARRATYLMRQHAIGRLQAKWVLFLDADEFMVVADGHELVAPDADLGRPVLLPWRTYVLHPGDDRTEPNPVRRLRHRLTGEARQWYKVLVPGPLAAHAGARVGSGCHELFIGEESQPSVAASHACLAHFPVRSTGQYRAKIAVNALQYLSMHDGNPDWGWHYRQPFELLKRQPAAFDLSAADAARDYARPPEVPAVTQTIEDPITYCGSELRYHSTANDADRSWQAVLAFATDIAKNYAGLMAESLRAAEAHDQEVVALRAESAAATAELTVTKEALAASERACLAARHSWTWAVGRAVVGPAAWARRLLPAPPFPARASNNDRIILGAGATVYPGWVATDRNVLDVTCRADFACRWPSSSVAGFLAEHVWEHLDEGRALAALANCFEFLRPGGRLRLAVPDGLHPEPAYREWVRPGGNGPGADDHRQFYTYRTLAAQLRRIGFRTRLLEYWDERGRLHTRRWSSADGHVERSVHYDQRVRPGIRRYTSLIVDAINPSWSRMSSRVAVERRGRGEDVVEEFSGPARRDDFLPLGFRQGAGHFARETGG